MSEEFNVGDIVRLKGGGPWMTVTSLRQADSVLKIYTVWFPEKGMDPNTGDIIYEAQLCSNEFPAESLEKA